MKNFHPTPFISGLVVGLLLAVVWYSSHPATPTGAPGAALGATSTAGTATNTLGTLGAATTTNATTTASGALSVADQPAGSSVTVESVTVPPPGVWVAVREVVSGALGNVLGAARVGGPRSSVIVPLLRATEPGRTYAVELYRDNGDDVFNLDTDSVYVDFTTGQPVIARFSTTQ
jgi:hypothetical protein